MRFLSMFFGCLLFLSCNKRGKDYVAPIDPVYPPAAPSLAIRAADISFLPELRTYGIVTKNVAGVPEDMLTTLKNAGMNTVRIRLWKDPATAHSGFAEVKQFAQEAKAMGIKVWLTVHYSDTWADPAQQAKPVLWNSCSFTQLKDSVYAYTKKIMTEINPEYIQIGNEINSGLLWPEGNISNAAQMVDIVKQGVKAVRETSSTTKIMLHYAGYQGAAAFYSNFTAVDYDLIGLSYYPIWHGKNLDDLQTALNSLAAQFNKKIVIAETAYPFGFGYNDQTNNIIGDNSQIIPAYPATPQGQADFLQKLKAILLNTTNGQGICYWGAEWIAFKGYSATNGSNWENQALWNFNNQAQPAINIFNQ